MIEGDIGDDYYWFQHALWEGIKKDINEKVKPAVNGTDLESLGPAQRQLVKLVLSDEFINNNCSIHDWLFIAAFALNKNKQYLPKIEGLEKVVSNVNILKKDLIISTNECRELVLRLNSQEEIFGLLKFLVNQNFDFDKIDQYQKKLLGLAYIKYVVKPEERDGVVDSEDENKSLIIGDNNYKLPNLEDDTEGIVIKVLDFMRNDIKKQCAIDIVNICQNGPAAIINPGGAKAADLSTKKESCNIL